MACRVSTAIHWHHNPVLCEFHASPGSLPTRVAGLSAHARRRALCPTSRPGRGDPRDGEGHWRARRARACRGALSRQRRRRARGFNLHASVHVPADDGVHAPAARPDLAPVQRATRRAVAAPCPALAKRLTALTLTLTATTLNDGAWPSSWRAPSACVVRPAASAMLLGTDNAARRSGSVRGPLPLGTVANKRVDSARNAMAHV